MTKWLEKTEILTWNVPDSRSHLETIQNAPIESLDSSVDAAA